MEHNAACTFDFALAFLFNFRIIFRVDRFLLGVQKELFLVASAIPLSWSVNHWGVLICDVAVTCFV
jgi:hypothetical protein